MVIKYKARFLMLGRIEEKFFFKGNENMGDPYIDDLNSDEDPEYFPNVEKKKRTLIDYFGTKRMKQQRLDTEDDMSMSEASTSIASSLSEKIG